MYVRWAEDVQKMLRASRLPLRVIVYSTDSPTVAQQRIVPSVRLQLHHLPCQSPVKR